jgi:hypothetical protein
MPGLIIFWPREYGESRALLSPQKYIELEDLRHFSSLEALEKPLVLSNLTDDVLYSLHSTFQVHTGSVSSLSPN